MPETDEDKVRRYTECLMNGVDLKRALKRLYDLEVNLGVYKEAHTYNYVKNYENSPELAKYAKRLRDKLFGVRKREIKVEPEDDQEHSALKKPKKEADTQLVGSEFAEAMKCVESGQNAAPRVAVDYSKYKVTKRTAQVKIEPKEEPIDEPDVPSSSSPVKKPKDYAPLVPTAPKNAHHHQKKEIPQSASLRADENMFKPRKDRQKVFAGRRRKIGEQVPTLLSLCQDVLSSNVHMIDHVGVVPYVLLKPALICASIDQLRRIVDANPMIADEIDEIFMDYVHREFPNYVLSDKDKRKNRSWREIYDRQAEKKHRDVEQRLMDAKMKAAEKRAEKTNATSGRQTMIIDMAHTRVRSKSFFNNHKDTQIKMTATPSAIQLSQARKNVKIEGKSQLRSITPRGGGVQSTSRSRSSNNNNSSSSGIVVKKTAPLMAKCRKMLKR